jgi:hypothetical protein
MRRAELLKFIGREVGEDGDSLLDSILQKEGIRDIDSTEKSNLKIVAKDIRDMLPTVSVTKRNMLYAEILKILDVEIQDMGKDTISSEKIKQKIEADSSRIETFVKDIDRSLTKYEAIFNLFWMRAGEAEMSGISHEAILKITSKALLGVKRDLEDSREKIMKEYNLLDENSVNRFNKKFHFKSPLFLSRSHNPQEEIDLKNKELVKSIMDRFWGDINESYETFQKIFLNSMNKEIELKRQGSDDTHLVEETQQKMVKLWGELEHSYKVFAQDMASVKEKMGENWSNLLLSQ